MTNAAAANSAAAARGLFIRSAPFRHRLPFPTNEYAPRRPTYAHSSATFPSTENGTKVTEPPFLRIVRGTPTPEEVAALVGALLSRQPVTVERPVRSRWRASALPARGPHPGPGAWRASALPRA